jgi:hypothetical protein
MEQNGGAAGILNTKFTILYFTTDKNNKGERVQQKMPAFLQQFELSMGSCAGNLKHGGTNS